MSRSRLGPPRSAQRVEGCKVWWESAVQNVRENPNGQPEVELEKVGSPRGICLPFSSSMNRSSLNRRRFIRDALWMLPRPLPLRGRPPPAAAPAPCRRAIMVVVPTPPRRSLLFGGPLPHEPKPGLEPHSFPPPFLQLAQRWSASGWVSSRRRSPSATWRTPSTGYGSTQHHTTTTTNTDGK